MEDDILLEPLKAYKSVYKDAVNEEAGKFFDELVEKSKIDVEANRQLGILLQLYSELK